MLDERPFSNDASEEIGANIQFSFKCDEETMRATNKPFDVAVVIQTLMRDTLMQAVRSVFQQTFAGSVQILIGIDRGQSRPELIAQLIAECPEQMAITVLDLGYSTCEKYGGIYSCHYGGALRTILSYAANSRHVAYLDDDDWFAPEHIGSLVTSIGEQPWAWSGRWFVDRKTDDVLCQDTWESMGPGAGVYAQTYGGFVGPSCLLVDKLACHSALPEWSIGQPPHGNAEDRRFLAALLKIAQGMPSRQFTSYYRVGLEGMHPFLIWHFHKAGVDLTRYLPPERIPSSEQLASYDRGGYVPGSAVPKRTAPLAGYVQRLY